MGPRSARRLKSARRLVLRVLPQRAQVGVRQTRTDSTIPAWSLQGAWQAERSLKSVRGQPRGTCAGDTRYGGVRRVPTHSRGPARDVTRSPHRLDYTLSVEYRAGPRSARRQDFRRGKMASGLTTELTTMSRQHSRGRRHRTPRQSPDTRNRQVNIHARRERA